MRSRRTWIAVLVLVAIVAPMLLASGESEGTKAGQQAKLVWLAMGPAKQKDADEVWAVFNTQLQKKLPGTTVDMQIVAAAAYADRWKLALSANEQIDIAGRYWVSNLDVEVAKGALLPLDDLLNKYGPDIKKNLPGWVLEKGKAADGKIYEIPCYQTMVDMRYALRFPKDLADKYGMKATSAQLLSQEFMTQASWDLLSAYLAKAKADGNLRKGVGTPVSWLWEKGTENVGAGVKVNFKGKPIKLYNAYDNEYFRAMIATQAKWYQDGYIRKDVLAMTDPRVDDGKPDGTIAWVHGSMGDDEQSQFDTTRYGYPIVVYSVQAYDRVSYAHSATNLGIAMTAKYPDRAMQVMNYLQSEGGKDLYNLLTWGLEGKHYKKVSANRIETIGYAGQGNADSPYGLWKWAIGNTAFSWLTQSDTDTYIDIWMKNNGSAVASQLMGWVPDPEPTKTEEAQIRAVATEYTNQLAYGVLGAGYEAKYQEFLGKLKAAGIDKVIAEYQRQVDKYFAGKK